MSVKSEAKRILLQIIGALIVLAIMALFFWGYHHWYLGDLYSVNPEPSFIDDP